MIMKYINKPLVIILLVALLFLGGHWMGSKSANDACQREQAEQSADASRKIVSNVMTALSIINDVMETNADAKRQSALESQRTQNDIKNDIAADDCATRDVPDRAAQRLREHKERIRSGTRTTTADKSNG